MTTAAACCCSSATSREGCHNANGRGRQPSPPKWAAHPCEKCQLAVVVVVVTVRNGHISSVESSGSCINLQQADGHNLTILAPHIFKNKVRFAPHSRLCSELRVPQCTRHAGAADVSADARPAFTAACRRSSSCSCFRCCVTSAPKEHTSICRAVSLSMPLDLHRCQTMFSIFAF